MAGLETFGVIGGGEFGAVAAQHLTPTGAEVLVFDKDPAIPAPPGTQRADLSAVASADVIMLAIPYDSYGSVLPELVEQSRSESLIVDVCSVKMEPTATFEAHGLLARSNVLMTHPLFGPQSVARGGVDDKNLVITKQTGHVSVQLVNTWRQQGINLVRMSAEEHDREMAKVHALTFFVGRALLEMGIEASPIATPYYSKLLELVDVERHHSLELFETIQRHNPFAREIREQFMAKLQELNDG